MISIDIWSIYHCTKIFLVSNVFLLWTLALYVLRKENEQGYYTAFISDCFLPAFCSWNMTLYMHQNSVSGDFIKYAKALRLEKNGISITLGYLFTATLKQLSGAILHKMVVAFCLVYILSWIRLEVKTWINLRLK